MLRCQAFADSTLCLARVSFGPGWALPPPPGPAPPTFLLAEATIDWLAVELPLFGMAAFWWQREQLCPEPGVSASPVWPEHHVLHDRTHGTGRTAQHGRFSGAARVTPDGIRPASRSEDEESLAGQKRASSQALGTIPKRRSSSRFIKRKKFDDELVESSLAKSSTRAKGASGVEPGCCSGSEPSSSGKKVSKAPSTPVPPSPSPSPSPWTHQACEEEQTATPGDQGSGPLEACTWPPAHQCCTADQWPDICPPGCEVQLLLHPVGSPGALVRPALRSCHLQAGLPGHETAAPRGHCRHPEQDPV